MKTQRLVGLAFCLAAALAVGQFAARGKTPGPPQAARTQTDPAQGNGKRAQAFIDAFNKGDAKAVAAFWTPDGDYIDEAGKQIRRAAQAIEKLYDKVFGGHEGCQAHGHGHIYQDGGDGCASGGWNQRSHARQRRPDNGHAVLGGPGRRRPANGTSRAFENRSPARPPTANTWKTSPG